jgi:hypothetical protein
MKMKKSYSLVLMLFMMNGLFAQQHTEIELIRSVYKLEKKAVVADYLQLTNEEAAAFWPIYEKYEIERSALGDRRIKIITKYVADDHKTSVVDADAMVKESAEIQQKEAGLREKYYEHVKKGVSPAIAIKFYQIEDAISVALRAKLWEELGK